MLMRHAVIGPCYCLNLLVQNNLSFNVNEELLMVIQNSCESTPEFLAGCEHDSTRQNGLITNYYYSISTQFEKDGLL